MDILLAELNGEIADLGKAIAFGVGVGLGAVGAGIGIGAIRSSGAPPARACFPAARSCGARS